MPSDETHGDLGLSGESITVTYHIHQPREDAARVAHDICIEQTVEFPEDLIYDERIRSLFGRVRSLRRVEAETCEAVIEFPAEVAGGELTQLVNVLFGNISLHPGIWLRRFELPDSLLRAFPGPRFGRAGIRRVLDVPRGPLLASAVKPMGLSPRELGEQAFQLALGGMDVIKDDHGLADQRFCPFEERVRRCVDGVSRAVALTGRRCLFFPNVTAPSDRIVDRARFARDAGAGGLVISPGLTGIDAVRRLAADDSLSLPLLAHPAWQGSFVVGAPRSGMSHGAIFGQLARLAGADAVIFPGHGGRFSFSLDECRDLIDGTGCVMGTLAPIFPVPAGGMTLERVPELLALHGSDVVLLIGGALHRHPGGLVEGCREVAELVRERRAPHRS